jgi:hypothetical protein
MSDAVDYGPLSGLIGAWQGDKGLDVAPAPDGVEEIPYFETLEFEAIGDVTNAEAQVLAVVRYQQVVSRKSNGEVFHHQTGYWTWDVAEAEVVQSIAIPRAVCVLAAGHWSGGDGPRIELSVAARLGDSDWGIVQSPFMRERARTTGFEHTLTLDGDTLSYAETTHLQIYGRSFAHTDGNTLTRIVGS